MIKPNDSEAEEGCKLIPSNCFLTITLDDRQQKITHDSTGSDTVVNYRRRHVNRLQHVTNLLTNKICPAIDTFMESYEIVTEISEALASKGKYFPRIHFHVLGYLSCPISFLLSMGDLYHMGFGYHIIGSLSKPQWTIKEKYIKKQKKLWNRYLKKNKLVTISLSRSKQIVKAKA